MIYAKSELIGLTQLLGSWPGQHSNPSVSRLEANICVLQAMCAQGTRALDVAASF